MSNRNPISQTAINVAVLLAAMFTASVWAVFFYLAGAGVLAVMVVWVVFFAIAGGILLLIASGKG